MAQKKNEMRIGEAEKKITILNKKVYGMADVLVEIANSVKKLVSESEENQKKGIQSVLTGSSSHNEGGKLKGKENAPLEVSEFDDFSAFRRDGHERLKFNRFEMPVFCGEKPDAWVYKAETYFDIHSLTELEKVKISICSFDPDTVDWFRYAHNRKAILTWTELKQRIFYRFRPSQERNLTSRFLAIKQ